MGIKILNIFSNKYDYKEKANKYKNKIIRKDVNSFKKYAIKKFKYNIVRGLSITTVPFFTHVTYDFENEISIIVLKELKEDKRFKDIDIQIFYDGFENSYKNLRFILNK